MRDHVLTSDGEKPWRARDDDLALRYSIQPPPTTTSSS